MRCSVLLSMLPLLQHKELLYEEKVTAGNFWKVKVKKKKNQLNTKKTQCWIFWKQLLFFLAADPYCERSQIVLLRAHFTVLLSRFISMLNKYTVQQTIGRHQRHLTGSNFRPLLFPPPGCGVTARRAEAVCSYGWGRWAAEDVWGRLPGV